MVLAWLIVLLFFAAPAVWLLYPAAESGFIIDERPGGSPRGPDLGQAGGRSLEESWLAGQTAIRYRVVRESPLGRPTVDASIDPVVTQAVISLPANPVGSLDMIRTAGTGVGSGNVSGSGSVDFGLPGRPIFAHTLSSARWPGRAGSGLGGDGTGAGSPAVIEWVAPYYPKSKLNSRVVCLVTLDGDGNKTTRVIYTETWRQFDGKRRNIQFFGGPDRWGFARAVVSALDQSIFWPATDSHGRKLAGRFIIDWTFCPGCPPESEAVRVVSGEAILRPGRSG